MLDDLLNDEQEIVSGAVVRNEGRVLTADGDRTIATLVLAAIIVLVRVLVAEIKALPACRVDNVLRPGDVRLEIKGVPRLALV